MKTCLSISLATAAALLSPAVSMAQSYPPGYSWDRTLEWKAGLNPGTAQGNPSTDKQGSPVWRYEWTVGGPINSANPWYLGPKVLMVWDDYWWGTTNQSNWARAYNGQGSDNNENPPITQYSMSHDLSEYKKAWEYMPLVRWLNPVIGYNEFSISGDMQVEWAGWGVSPDVDVEVVIGKKDSQNNTFSVIWAQTYSNPTPNTTNPPYPRLRIPISIPVLRMNPGDGLIFTVRAKKNTPFALPNWVVMYDNPKITLIGASKVPYVK